MSACNAQNKTKANYYWSRLSASQQVKYKEMCVRNHIIPNDAGGVPEAKTDVKPPANCDAATLRDKGMENINMGQHAAALAQFEASLRCKDDPYTRSLAFAAACNAQNASKAKLYWKKLTQAEQTKFRQMCIRNHIDPAQ
jgi:hypothetical protein